MKGLLATLASLAVLNAAAQAEPPAFRLGDAAAPVSYDLHLAIDPREPTFHGEVRIRLRIARPLTTLWLNAEKLQLTEAVFLQGDRRIAARVTAAKEDFVGFEIEGGLAPGDAVAEVRWSGPIEPLSTRGLFRQKEGDAWYAVTQLEAMHARRVLPCFDEPGWKTPWRLTIDAPSADRAVSNTPLESARPVADRPGWTRHAFAATRPLPSYLLALAVGPYDIVEGGRAGLQATPLRYVAGRGRGAETRFAKASTPRLLESLERYFGRPYPFEKLDSVSIPATVGFGAMENAGMITYSSEILLARPSQESLAFQRRYASVGAHEIAHQWFGDLVTLAWWNDIWLNEAFATWMARKTVRATYPALDTAWRTGEQRRRALVADRLMSARRVANPVLVKTDIYGAFDAITYNKGAEVLAMFETWAGEERFREGVRRFLDAHAYANATSQDFFRALAEASGRGEAATAAIRSFIDQPGVPLVDVALRCTPRGATLSLAQQRLVPRGQQGAEGTWTTPACFRVGRGGATARQCVEITGTQEVALEGGCPDWIAANAEGAGHWVARYDAATASRLERHATRIPEHEAVARVVDARLLTGTGLLPRDAALRVAETFLGHPGLGPKHAAIELLADVRREALTPAQATRLERMERRLVLPLARRVGWTPRRGEGLAIQDLRGPLLDYAVSRVGDRQLRQEAHRLARRWLADPNAIDASIAAAVLRATARTADAALFDAMAARLATTRDRRDRVDLLWALAAVRDPALQARSHALLLDEGLMDGRDAATYLEKAVGDPFAGSTAFAFLRAHWPALVAKVPPDSLARIMRSMTELCTPADRDAFRGFFEPQVGAIQGATRALPQTLEAMDICIAANAT